jgi:hypothetical protein
MYLLLDLNLAIFICQHTEYTQAAVSMLFKKNNRFEITGIFETLTKILTRGNVIAK